MGTRLILPVLVLAFASTATAQLATPLTGGTQPPAPGNVLTNPPTTNQPNGPNAYDADYFSSPPIDPGRRLWGGAEYLLWWVQGQRVPALVTTSLPGTTPSQAGVLGLPGTSVLFGDSRLNDGSRSGVRLSVGMWLDDCQTRGLGSEFFILGNSGESFTGRSSGTPILARPFFNTLTQTPDAQIAALDPLAFGSVSASAVSQSAGCVGVFPAPSLWGLQLFRGSSGRVSVFEP